METYDVLVVGAGPAGATCAQRLAEAGLKTLLIDKKRLPRYKTCSGLIVPDALRFLEEHFGPIPAEAYAKPKELKGVKIIQADQVRRELAVSAHNVWRGPFDHWLARSSKTEIRDRCSFLHLSEEESSLRVRLLSRGSAFELETRYLVGADGGPSQVRDALSPSFKNEIGWIFAYQVHYRYDQESIELDPYYFYAFLDEDFSQFFAWANFKDDHLILGTSVRRGADIYAYYSAFVEHMRQAYGFVPKGVEHKSGCFLNDMALRGKFHLGRGRVLLVGEAAGFLNMLGEGISSALSTGYLAGEAIVQGMTSGRAAWPIYAELVEGEKRRTQLSQTLARRAGVKLGIPSDIASSE